MFKSIELYLMLKFSFYGFFYPKKLTINTNIKRNFINQSCFTFLSYIFHVALKIQLLKLHLKNILYIYYNNRLLWHWNCDKKKGLKKVTVTKGKELFAGNPLGKGYPVSILYCSPITLVNVGASLLTKRKIPPRKQRRASPLTV